MRSVRVCESTSCLACRVPGDSFPPFLHSQPDDASIDSVARSMLLTDRVSAVCGGEILCSALVLAYFRRVALIRKIFRYEPVSRSGEGPEAYSACICSTIASKARSSSGVKRAIGTP